MRVNRIYKETTKASSEITNKNTQNIKDSKFLAHFSLFGNLTSI